MRCLNLLPVDVLEMILSLIEAVDIAYLWFTGDSLLHLALRHGGVKMLFVSDPISFPRLISQFRGLKVLHLRLGEQVSNYQRIIPGFDWTLMPPSLEELLLDFPTALVKLAAAQPLNVLFPKLIALSLPKKPMLPPDYAITSLLAGLPNTVHHLHLPNTTPVSIDTLISLPCRFVSLKVHVRSIPKEREGEFRAAKVFEALSTLELVCTSAAWARVIPPSATGYSWKSAKVDQTATAEDLRLLPAQLRWLDVSWWPSDCSLLQLLPRSIEYLIMADSHLLDEVAAQLCVQNLPPNLKELSGPYLMAGDNCALLPFPKGLQKCHSLDIFRPLTSAQEYPVDLEGWNIYEAEDDDICTIDPDNQEEKCLPPSVLDLYISFELSEMPRGLDKLPPRLTALKLDQLEVFDPILLLSFPYTLIKLELVANTILPMANEEEWCRAWPPRLQSLKWKFWSAFRPPVSPLCAPFWASFTHLPLRDILIEFEDVSHLPKSLAFLPRTLSGVSLRAFRRGAPLLDSFFSSPPPSLQFLSLLNFACASLTLAFCLSLPKTLRYLKLDQTGSLRHLALGTSSKRMPQMWQFLDQLPPHLCFDFTAESPDFVFYQVWRQKDDLEEDLAGVLNTPTATNHRLFNTPRRKKN